MKGTLRSMRSALLLAAVVLVVVAAFLFIVVVGRERERVSVSGTLQANTEGTRAFGIDELAVGVSPYNWFDGGGPVRAMTLMPGNGQIAFGLCSSDLFDAVVREWSAYSLVTDQANMPLVYLGPVDALTVRTASEDPFLVRLFPGGGSHQVSLYESLAELHRTEGEWAFGFTVDVGYDLWVRDYDATLSMTLVDYDAPGEPPQVSGQTGVAAEAQCWGLILRGPDFSEGGSGESIRFIDLQDPFLGIKGATDHLRMHGVTGQLSIGDQYSAFEVPLHSLELRFSQGTIFDLSFVEGELSVAGDVDSVRINGVEQVETKWVAWADVSRELVIAVLAAIAGAIAGVAAMALVSRQSPRT